MGSRSKKSHMFEHSHWDADGRRILKPKYPALFKLSHMNRLKRRIVFLAKYHANPCNYLPGYVLSAMYKANKTQQRLELAAKNWITRENERRHDIGAPLIPWPVS